MRVSVELEAPDEQKMRLALDQLGRDGIRCIKINSIRQLPFGGYARTLHTADDATVERYRREGVE